MSGSGGTWLWDESGWEQLFLEREPHTRTNAAMVYDGQRERVVLFGGVYEEQLFGDTWEFDGENWQKLDLPNHPSERWGHVMFYDPQQQRIILFGGWSKEGPQDDMWELVIP